MNSDQYWSIIFSNMIKNDQSLINNWSLTTSFKAFLGLRTGMGPLLDGSALGWAEGSWMGPVLDGPRVILFTRQKPFIIAERKP